MASTAQLSDPRRVESDESASAAAAILQRDASHASPTPSYDLAWRLEKLRLHGGFTLAYSTAVQAGLQYYSTSSGYVAFARKWGFVHVLGDPVAAPDDRSALLDGFLSEFPNAGFYQISPPTAEYLERRRFYINEMGVDTRIDLPAYHFNGKSKEFLRYAGNWLQRRGYRVEEKQFSDVSLSELRELDDRWKSTRKIKREVGFLNRPLYWNDERDVRRFFLFDPAGKIIAFVFFDPLYANGEVFGYATAFKRRDGAATNGYTEPGIMRTALESFKRENRSVLRLGLSPLANIENRAFRKNWFLHHSFRYGFRSWWVNRYFYNLQGHASFKRRFCGVEEKTYFASPSISNDLRIAGMLRLAGII
jgi:phosphatidylglycerol lysyltransferase